MTDARPTLWLASTSPRRRELLERTGFALQVAAPEVDESLRPDEAPAAYVERLAEAKAAEVRARVEAAARGVVVAADTVVVHDGHILGKPRDRDDARETLRRLSGQWHRVLTGWCVAGDEPRVAVEETRVRFKAVRDPELTWYLDTQEWRDKAGGYGIQGRGAFLVATLEGSYANVVGLPLSAVVDALADCGLHPAPLSARERRTEIIR